MLMIVHTRCWIPRLFVSLVKDNLMRPYGTSVAESLSHCCHASMILMDSITLSNRNPSCQNFWNGKLPDSVVEDIGAESRCLAVVAHPTLAHPSERIVVSPGTMGNL